RVYIANNEVKVPHRNARLPVIGASWAGSWADVSATGASRIRVFTGKYHTSSGRRSDATYLAGYNTRGAGYNTRTDALLAVASGVDSERTPFWSDVACDFRYPPDRRPGVSIARSLGACGEQPERSRFDERDIAQRADVPIPHLCGRPPP